ncbi:nucleoside-diphosphate-sugar epimerase [Chthonomonas calidirosea]|uniref:Nucleoside-diphosphate-sugar epimerases n=1 Tax=Chthonomonas calidirosea (strain DSM 23976 / ICMP 18418 / T49) TaxID=1303518 RepID=S0EZP5_CHTCT|nr:SDR family oxidoreductase [Chthonomonas calidirosea]CCW35974.1 Nucleoside-diphosphate-sugar epimerases [Chthonomonas calidirosea T49]CEK17665.1 nucleoside-diphosphate-sugar epimerase [Chthonomonas calidirosea]CEK17666.1 nucleoside-diphosphate-sugar epimerase [Chthonomonas calidirosea]CEK18699.1 nucleoside-diphosphate-sugar epimerase [Chthonomonas calidirosea]
MEAIPKIESALVTGGAGFIGAHLAKTLASQGTKVRVLDNFSSGTLENLRGFERRIDIVEGDVRNALACRNACRGVQVVFHLAALVSVPISIQDPIQADSVNIGGTLNMLIAARDQGVQRFVFSSSAAVYGDTAIIPTHEDVLPKPLSPYGVQKLAGEHYAQNFTNIFGLQTVALRYFNVYGPHQNPNSPYAAVIPKFISAVLEGKSPTIFGDGEQTRDFCYVGDVVRANLLAATAPSEKASGGVFNIAGGRQHTLNTLWQMLQSVMGTQLCPTYAAPRTGDIRHSGADISRAESLLGYRPATSLEEGLRLTVEAYRKA